MAPCSSSSLGNQTWVSYPAFVNDVTIQNQKQCTGPLYGKHGHFFESQVFESLVCNTNDACRGSIYRGAKLWRQIKTRRSNIVIYSTAENIGIPLTRPSEDNSVLQLAVNWLDAFYRFSRPHTIIGTALGVVSVSLLAIQSSADISLKSFVGLLQALVPALLMNVYIVGLNQVYDIKIDKVNKPYLPLASGDFSLATGIGVIGFCALMSMGCGMMVGSRPLLWALTVSLVLGTAYSAELPFLRWKRSALAAAACILCVRAVVVQIAFYLHMQVFVLGRSAIFSRPLLFATGFMCFFSIVIALFKDIPDVEGDKIYGINSFSVRMGQKKVFWSCILLLEAAYAVAIAVGVTSPILWSRVAMTLGHAMMACLLWLKAQNTDLKNKASITSCYMFIWKLFYGEYLLLPFMR